MSILAPACSDIGLWLIGDGHGLCPDCESTIAPGAISAHVDWHQGLRRGFLGGMAACDAAVIERCTPANQLVRFLHELQIAGLRIDDHR